METVNQLLKELDVFWNASDDDRFKGEHPDCLRIQDEIKEILSGMNEDAICEVLDSLGERQSEQVQGIVEDLVDDKPFLEAYIK